jgi:hypothetical protein
MSLEDKRLGLCAMVIVLTFILAESIALGKSEEKYSFGLPGVLTCFEVLCSAVAGYAFGKKSGD